MPQLDPRTREKWLRLFVPKVDRTGGPDSCWPWTRARFPLRTTAGVLFDYGMYGWHCPIDNKSKTSLAHRIAYQLEHDTVLVSEQCVLHSCDNPPCCNPSHLFLGDRKANSDDKIAKGRYRNGIALGSDHGNAKLTDDAVRAMRAEYASGGIGQIPLAAKYGVSQATAWAILRRQTWKHVL